MSQGVCRIDMTQKRSAYIVSNPQIIRTDELFFVSYQPLISHRARYPPSRMVLWDLSN